VIPPASYLVYSFQKEISVIQKLISGEKKEKGGGRKKILQPSIIVINCLNGIVFHLVKTLVKTHKLMASITSPL